MEYPFTSMTEKQRQEQIRVQFMTGFINVISVTLFIAIVGVSYQLTGLIAMEREVGMSQLIDCMMPTTSHWQAQAARFMAAHLALDIIYAPGWIITGVILQRGIFSHTSIGITIVDQLLAGLAVSSSSVFGASFFKKAQLSGNTVAIANMLLAVIAQLAGVNTNGAVVVLGLLFPPMNYVFFSVSMARWEKQKLPTNLLRAAPESPWTTPGIALWIFYILQIIVYPILAAVVERVLYGTASPSRKISSLGNTSALTLDGFTKEYRPNSLHRRVGAVFGMKVQNVLAVNNLSLDVVRGEIMVLVGANGSGKSTTLEAVAGLSTITSGEIRIDYGSGGGKFGLCPQRNVLWDSLTVKEHVQIFNGLKTPKSPNTQQQLFQLLGECDLSKKVNAKARTLSGGQRRKLQLAMMFTGGSSVCCVDEVSSGLDPISRRKVWDILLAERGRRTILFSTHFLDEAELLADHIAILSKGTLEAQGSTVELKHRLGSGYRIHVYQTTAGLDMQLEGMGKEIHFDETIYTVQDSALVTQIVTMLENEGITDYRVAGPTIEDVFLKVAHEQSDISSNEHVNVVDEMPKIDGPVDGHSENKDTQLQTGKRIGMVRQTWVMFCKRVTILRRNCIPYIAACLIPVIASGLVTLFLNGAAKPTCTGPSTYTSPSPLKLSSISDISFVAGPRNRLSLSMLDSYVSSVSGSSGSRHQTTTSALSNLFHLVDTLEEFHDYINVHRANVTPGGFYLGDSSSKPTFAWDGDLGDFPFAAVTQNALDHFLTNTSIGFQFQYFAIPWQTNVGNLLQLLTYFGLAMAVYPSLFALYPTVERLRRVRAMHYGNGVRTLPLWLAHLCFDFCIVVIASVLAIIIFRAASDAWYHPAYLFVVFFLYGLCSTLLAYLISLVAKSQLAAFAVTAGMQCVFFLTYFIAYMAVLTYAPTTKVNSYISICHFAISAVTPVGSLLRAMFVSLNIFSLICRDHHILSYPGDITAYGGPVVYLIVQSIVLLSLILRFDGGSNLFALIKSKSKPADVEEKEQVDQDVANELSRVADSNDGLRVLHLTKSFNNFVAVEDVTFGVGRGEVFALLGPNGAGKTTLINMIRGDMLPSHRDGEIFVEDISVTRNRATARSHLGVCPQFDAIDQMTVVEHLRFYARIRGVPNVDHNVSQVIRAVGLTPYQHRMAMELSGGNKRKLSLAIALMGNPSVLLLDEPSSGMDAASKRVMWKTLGSVAAGRSIVLTTHSMEEAACTCGPCRHHGETNARSRLDEPSPPQVREHVPRPSCPFSGSAYVGRGHGTSS